MSLVIISLTLTHIGFKKGRVTFKDTMNQMVSGASAATDNRGGKNATQVGLGSTLATVDTDSFRIKSYKQLDGHSIWGLTVMDTLL